MDCVGDVIVGRHISSVPLGIGEQLLKISACVFCAVDTAFYAVGIEKGGDITRNIVDPYLFPWIFGISMIFVRLHLTEDIDVAGRSVVPFAIEKNIAFPLQHVLKHVDSFGAVSLDVIVCTGIGNADDDVVKRSVVLCDDSDGLFFLGLFYIEFFDFAHFPHLKHYIFY